ncbi:hypothetical protein CYMTET_55733 [Cymbomonas tetramitiformis]|uniref:F-box domain-containing protein n=1 Tax=Cymbomonas tetramitiformis TaxID=36881 RepID=A0AAE0BE40_9CHLO|nr:hypothetical protein CYMTET_55733 [Cymbomonas tetramitiformis]
MEEDVESLALVLLPLDLLAKILLETSPKDICNFGKVSKRSRLIASNDFLIWDPLCHKFFGKRTCIYQWFRHQSDQSQSLALLALHSVPTSAPGSIPKSSPAGNSSPSFSATPATPVTLPRMQSASMTSASIGMGSSTPPGRTKSGPACGSRRNLSTPMLIGQLRQELGTRSRSNSELADDNDLESFRDLYCLLRRVEGLIGVWKAVGEGPKGGVYVVRWAGHAVLLTELSGNRRGTRLCGVVRALWGGSSTSLLPTVLGPDSVAIRHGSPEGLPHFRGMAASEAAEAAATGGAADLAALQGAASPSRRPSFARSAPASFSSSPPGSFGHEFVRFLSGQVEQAASPQRRSSRSKRKARAKNPGEGGTHLGATTLLKRLNARRRCSETPLAGIWWGVYGNHGVQLIEVSYPNKGTITATKLTGDAHVPAEECVWIARLATEQVPSDDDAVRIDSYDSLDVRAQADGSGSQEDEEDEEERDLEDVFSRQNGSNILDRFLESIGSSDMRVKQFNSPVGRGKVARCYEGNGTVAEQGFSNVELVEGQLLEYESGAIGFAFLHLEVVVLYNRVEGLPGLS